MENFIVFFRPIGKNQAWKKALGKFTYYEACELLIDYRKLNCHAYFVSDDGQLRQGDYNII
jgi:hypothetical protein